MSIQRIALLFALSLTALYGQNGQTFAQPVREVDGFAKTSIRGVCTVSVPVGAETSGFDQCTLRTTSGATVPTFIPAGKVLVIEEASASCRRSSQDVFEQLALGPVQSTLRIIPVTTQGTAAGFTHAVGFTNGRIYFRAGESPAGRLTMGAPATQLANCAVLVSGHLVDVQ
jgi:hypothetical protein